MYYVNINFLLDAINCRTALFSLFFQFLGLEMRIIGEVLLNSFLFPIHNKKPEKKPKIFF